MEMIKKKNQWLPGAEWKAGTQGIFRAIRLFCTTL